MSSKNPNKKSDNNNNRAEEQALKEAEIVAELAPNEKTRKEVEELIERIQDDSCYYSSRTRTRGNRNRKLKEQ